MAEDVQQIRTCPHCGQPLLFGPGSVGKTMYCPKCDTPVRLDSPRDIENQERASVFLYFICASLLGVVFTFFGALVVAVVCGLLLQLLMPGLYFGVPMGGSASGLKAIPISVLFLSVPFLPFLAPAAMIVGCVTQAVSGKSKLHVLRILVVCSVIDILAVGLLVILDVAH
jgi:hypothetical protein